MSKSYDVLEPLQHDGSRYEPGAVVDTLTQKQAKQLQGQVPPVVRARPAASGGQSGKGGSGKGGSGKGGSAKKADGKESGSGDAGTQPTEPTDAAERHATLKAFMAELEVPDDPTGSETWTNGGKPDTFALAASLGWDSVSAAERDQAWDEVLAEREQDGD